MMIETRTWNIWSFLIFFLSYFSWFCLNLIWSSFPVKFGFSNQDFYGVAHIAFNLPQFWFTLIMVCIICICPDLLWKFVQKLWRPTRLDVIEELEFIKTSIQCSKDNLFKNVREQRMQFVKSFIKNSKNQSVNEEKNKQLPMSSSRPSTKSLDAGEDNNESKQQPSFDRAKTCPIKLKSNKSDLGFAEFGICRRRSDYIMSQHAFMSKAMIKKEFSARLSFENDVKENEDDSDFDESLVKSKQNKKNKEYAIISAEDEDDKNEKLKKPKKLYSSLGSFDDDDDEDEMHPL